MRFSVMAVRVGSGQANIIESHGILLGIGPIWTLEVHFGHRKRPSKHRGVDGNAKSQTALPARICLAHNPPVPHFAESIKAKFGVRAKGCRISGIDDQASFWDPLDSLTVMVLVPKRGP